LWGDVNIVEEYDKQFVYFMFLKCYHHLHSMTKCKVACEEQKFDENFNLDFFEQTTNTSEPVKEHVTKELLILTQYQVDSKEIRCHFQWLRRHEVVFLIVDFFHLPNFRHCKITI
jgi:hypothetical protein